MKYYVDFLAEINKGDIAPVYLFYGPENYLREQAVLRLREAVLPAGGEELNYDVLDGSAVPVQDIVASASYTPFVQGRRLVVVRDPGIYLPAAGKKDKDNIESLLAYLAAPCPGTCLVFETAQNVDRRKKIYKETTRLGRVIEFARLKPADLVKWLAKLARQENCVITRDAAGELLARCGQDMYTLYHEMQKLTCYVGAHQTIDPAAVRELVAGRLEESIFEVVDAIGEKNITRALSGMRNLLLQKQQPQQIIGMVARQFRLILQVQGLAGEGFTREQIIAALKLHPFVYRKIYGQRKNFSRGQLIRALNNLTDLDYYIKTGQAAFYPAMETFIIQVCVASQKGAQI